jgi:NaMN:DMB phosphoribosyltransferase
VTRAVRESVGFDLRVIDAGLAERPATDVAGDREDAVACTGSVDEGSEPGADIRDGEPVPRATEQFECGRALGGTIDADRLLLAETIPGGTTTAMGVLAALGERTAVSSSLPENPVKRKRSAVRTGLAASDLERGDLAGQPPSAVRHMGDPVLGALAGVAFGVPEDVRVTLAGGTQLACVGALARHAGVDRPLELATTSYVAGDETADIEGLARDLDLDLRVTDPGFGEATTPGLARYAEGEAKEGVGMGGALALAEDRGVTMATVRERAAEILERCLAEAP